MSQGKDFPNLTSLSDERLERLESAAKSGMKGSDARRNTTSRLFSDILENQSSDTLKRIRSERQRRAKVAERQKMETLQKEREETIKLLTDRPGRRATLLTNSNNPFSITR